MLDVLLYSLFFGISVYFLSRPHLKKDPGAALILVLSLILFSISVVGVYTLMFEDRDTLYIPIPQAAEFEYCA